MKAIFQLFFWGGCCLMFCTFLAKTAEAIVIYDWHVLDTYSADEGWDADIGQISASFMFADYVVDKGLIQLISDGPNTPPEYWPEPEAIIDFKLDYTVNCQTTTYTRDNLSVLFDREYPWDEAHDRNITFSANRETFFFDFRVYSEPGNFNNSVFSIWSADFYLPDNQGFFHGSWDRRHDSIPVPEPNTITLFMIFFACATGCRIIWPQRN